MISDLELVCESTEVAPKCVGDVGTDIIVAA